MRSPVENLMKQEVGISLELAHCFCEGLELCEAFL